jgi:hypothetical protein
MEKLRWPARVYGTSKKTLVLSCVDLQLPWFIEAEWATKRTTEYSRCISFTQSSIYGLNLERRTLDKILH